MYLIHEIAFVILITIQIGNAFRMIHGAFNLKILRARLDSLHSSTSDDTISTKFVREESQIIKNADKKLQKIEQVKLDSNYLQDPLKAEMDNDQIYVGQDAGI